MKLLSNIKYSIELNFELRELELNLCMSQLFECEAKSG